MKIAIWSDIACPFCYVGKRHLELALKELEFADKIQVEYHAYMLNKDYHNPNEEDVFTYLAREKQMPRAQVLQMTGHVKSYADAVGIQMHFEKQIPANTFNSHRLIALAATQGLQSAMKERLFKAHFEEGLNLEKDSVLRALALEVGLPESALQGVFEGDDFKLEVSQDLYQAQLLGISGVPFFLLMEKYAISGAQPVDVFKQALRTAFEEWEAQSA